jgi:hypothetical protein
MFSSFPGYAVYLSLPAARPFMHYFMCLLLYSRISWNAYCTFQYLNTKEVFASFFFPEKHEVSFFLFQN